MDFDFESLFVKVLSKSEDKLMRMRRYEEGGYEIVTFCDWSQFTVVIKNVCEKDEAHWPSMAKSLEKLQADLSKPVRCEVHFKKPRKQVPQELKLHRWGDYATFVI
jgi:hypothetical protein